MRYKVKTNLNSEELMARVLVLHDCGFFFDQELDNLLFKGFSLMIISIDSTTELDPLLSRLIELPDLPVSPGCKLLHHGLPLGDQFLACLQHNV